MILSKLFRLDGVDCSGESYMRSEKVFEALNALQNRFLLFRITSEAFRGFHKPRTRIPDTMNAVLDKIAGSETRYLVAKPNRKKGAGAQVDQNNPQRGTSEVYGRRSSLHCLVLK